MLKKKLVLMCGALLVGTLTFLSAAQNPSDATANAAAAAAQQAAPQGDLSTLAGGGEETAGTGTLEPHSEVFDAAISAELSAVSNAAIREAQTAARAGRPRPFVPVPEGAAARPAAVSAPTAANDPDSSVQAANDLIYFRNHDMSGAEVPTTERSTIMEPTTVNLGDTVFYTGNWYAAKSTNGGATFSYINPYTFFPSINGGFCCDQVSAYAPAQDMALWGLQYIDDGNSNTLRIARAIGAAGVNANSWQYWNLNPQLVGFANGVWFDYPSFTVGSTFLYISSNAFLTSNNSFTGNVMIRIPLADLAAGGAVGFSYFKSNIGTERMTEGAGTTMYWGGFTTTTQMRIHRWADASGTIFWDNINLNAFNWLNRDGVATSPDGTNWALRADSRPTGAYVAGGVLGFMWTAKQGGARPKPYTVHARFSEATRALLTQADIWHTDYAWMYPAVMPSSDGYLGGSLQIGGAVSGTFAYPGTQIWVTDDVTGASNTVGALYFASASNDGPNNNAWGDFFSIRRHKVRPRTWVSSSHYLSGGGFGSNAVPKYLWFGREHDNPIKAAMTSPAPGSVLPGSATNFVWNTGAYATQYWIYVGTTGVGSANIWNENMGAGTSRLVTGIPTNSAPVYVRLWTNLTGIGWEYTDYTYTAAAPPACVGAAMTSPAPGGTLLGTSVNFMWNAGAGNTQYYLYVGTTPGGSQVYAASQGVSLSHVVSGIPINGLPVYVRLWSFCGGWTFVDYTYQTSARTARLTSPANRSVLAGAAQTFTWKPGTASTQYWLYVGNSRGLADIYNVNQGAGVSVVVPGLPVDGRRIYVRLWSLLAGVWNYVDYEFTAAGTARARLSTPAEGSVLPGAAATFNWFAGTAAAQYWVYLGTTQGASNLLNQNMGALLTVNAAGLPTDRRPVYMRLWSLIGGSWVYNDYVFRAYDGGAVRARMATPFPEPPALTGTSTTLRWNAGSGATQYWVYVGTTVGAANILNQNMGTSLSVAVAGLPSNAPAYVRLWSLVGGVWAWNDYEYRTAP